ncbi:MAG TPA: acyl-CoA dehydratase activase [Terriglobales bacterium]|nr:acyl-CoA dehydratase activase [Terriglobales bacterium]
MLTMGIDIGSRSTQCVILEDGELLSYGNVETGPESAKSAYAAVDAAVYRRGELWGENRMQLPDVKTDHLRIEDMDYILGTGYGRAVVPFAHGTLTEIRCHARGAHWLVPGVSPILDMGGQDCKGIRVNERGDVTRFVMNDKCAGGTGRFIEIIADILKVPLSEVGELSLTSTKHIPFTTVCAVIAKSKAVALIKQGASKADILAGLHESISQRVLALLKGVGIADKFVITGGIGKNVGVVTRIREKLGGMEITIPAEPQIAGAVGAALFALDRAKKKAAITICEEVT